MKELTPFENEIKLYFEDHSDEKCRLSIKINDIVSFINEGRSIYKETRKTICDAIGRLKKKGRIKTCRKGRNGIEVWFKKTELEIILFKKYGQKHNPNKKEKNDKWFQAFLDGMDYIGKEQSRLYEQAYAIVDPKTGKETEHGRFLREHGL